MLSLHLRRTFPAIRDCGKNARAAFFLNTNYTWLHQKRDFARRRGRSGKSSRLLEEEEAEAHVKPNVSPSLRPEEAWVQVIEEATQQPYWWNRATNETTALNAPKPVTPYLSQDPNYRSVQEAGQRYVAATPPSLGQTLKEGFAFGAGFGIARGVIGSMFGGSGSHNGDDDDDGGSGEWI